MLRVLFYGTKPPNPEDTSSKSQAGLPQDTAQVNMVFGMWLVCHNLSPEMTAFPREHKSLLILGDELKLLLVVHVKE